MQEWEERAYELQEAREQGMECGIQAMVLDNLEEGIPKEKILLKLRKLFSLDASKAEAYFERFSKTGL
ncbi:MAG: hypothetical protein Q4E91_13770 [Lachnospiraceae bacterium]|nr:hypothetical protein [Lachnospiraceae bacterium]